MCGIVVGTIRRLVRFSLCQIENQGVIFGRHMGRKVWISLLVSYTMGTELTLVPEFAGVAGGACYCVAR